MMLRTHDAIAPDRRAWAEMRAAVIERPGVAALRRVSRPVLGAGEVLVRSRRAGVCRTDLSILRGEVPAALVRYPCVPGHEWSGTVQAVGADVDRVTAGDRVACEGRIPCGRCPACRDGATNLCADQRQHGFDAPGGFGELVSVPAPLVHRVPDHVSLDEAVLVEPAACVLRALTRAAPAPGATVGVVGVGTLGSLALRLVRLFEPQAVLAYGVRREERAVARRLGADRALDATTKDPERATRDLLNGGLDLVIETAGSPSAVDLATRVTRPGGRVALLGLAGASSVLELPTDRIVRRDLTVVGNLSYTSSDWAHMVRLLDEARVSLSGIVTHRFPLERFEEAFELLARPVGSVGKVLLTLD
jgi:threonine dehydrogenase-like Zn-dependent dehydrogenase